MIDWEQRPATNSTAFTFANLGDSIVGTVRGANWYEGADRFTGKPDARVRILTIETDDGQMRDVWLRSSQLHDVVAAEAPQPGDRIRITWADNRDTGKPIPMKVYACKVKRGDQPAPAAAPVPAADVDDLL